ncbi:sulfotransferase family protein [Nonomuraea sp. NPDC050202]|uniref:sulfotransferase family protein n=1 Tax=Nonomuraea sp. NPDC050202 TaxID=3155035 RepID=UPI0033CAD2B0
MKVIGAGLPRTATLAQRVFLEGAGVGECYHMTRVWDDLTQVQYWVDAFEGRPDWSAVFRGYQATVDWPGAFYWRELMVAFPEAKVVLSVRDGESWAASMRSTIWSHLFDDTLMRDLSAGRAKVEPVWAQYRRMVQAMWRKSGLLGPCEGEFDSRAASKAMAEYNEEVRETVPEDRLLVWSPEDGWETLAKFLEIPFEEPSIPPVNTESMFQQRTCRLSLESLNRWSGDQHEATTR